MYRIEMFFEHQISISECDTEAGSNLNLNITEIILKNTFILKYFKIEKFFHNITLLLYF